MKERERNGGEKEREEGIGAIGKIGTQGKEGRGERREEEVGRGAGEKLRRHTK